MRKRERFYDKQEQFLKIKGVLFRKREINIFRETNISSCRTRFKENYCIQWRSMSGL